jgi:hypothetical protein
MSFFDIIVVLICACQTTASNLPSQPVETVTVVQHLPAEAAPEPTEAPVVDAGILFKRQYPPTICGYWSCEYTLKPAKCWTNHQLATPFACPTGSACVSNALVHYGGCCATPDITACNIIISCVDYLEYAAGGFNPYLYDANTGYW